MYYYLFDQRSTKAISSKQLDQIKSWIKTSPIAGQQFDLASPQLLSEKSKQLATNKKAATVVVIGDDLSLDLAISGVQASKTPATIGFIPTVISQSSALLGLTDWRQACKVLQQRKTRDFSVFSINGYCVLSHAQLSPRTTPADHAGSAYVTEIKLDGQLKLSTPMYRCSISSLAHQTDYHEHPHACLVEIYNLPKFSDKIQTKIPLIRTKLRPISDSEEVLVRLPFSKAEITTHQPLLLDSLVPLSGNIKVTKHAQAQSMVIARSEGPSA